jgi:hypothetical protein
LLAKCRARAHAVERDLAAGQSAAETKAIRRLLVRVAVK